MKIFTILVIYFFIFVIYTTSSKLDELRGKKLPPCRACNIFVNSFKKGMERTARGKFEGGDTAWEEKKLGSYSRSEIRLVEIQEKLCSDVEEGQDQCYLLAEQYDHELEEWWFKYQDSTPDFYQYFCIDSLKHCCPENHFGPNCTLCPGFPNICGGNGKCKGAGTRKGNGKCLCNEGYSGEFCHICASNYYESYKDDKKILCSKCHHACDGSCNQAGPKGCITCAKGWLMDTERGCLDANECAADRSVCNPLQFCVNTEGSFKCLECDRACSGCTGDGPDMCINCARGYANVDNVCVDSEQEDRKTTAFLSRYLTYFGLCVATCLIFQRSVILAAVIGLAVAIYITVSEYMLNISSTANSPDIGALLQSAT